MGIVDRVKNILLQPKTEWPVIAGEPATTSDLFTGYALILALLPLAGTLAGALLAFGAASYLGFGYLATSAVVGYIISLGIVFLMGIIAKALAPSFDGSGSDVDGMKLVVYSATAVWVAGLLSFLPVLGFLIGLAGFGYAAYLLYLGAGPVMKVPEAKAVGYTAVVILIWIGLAIVVGGLIIAMMVSSFMGAAVTGAAMGM